MPVTAISAILLAVEQQHIGQSTPPTHAAGVDPAFIPGLVPARPDRGGAERTESRVTEAEAPADGVPAQDGDPQDDTPVKEVTAKEPGPDAEPHSEAEPEPDSEPEQEQERAQDDDGPVFEVSDRRGAIVADGSGITFRLDTEEAEFGWDEIKAVEIGIPRFGRRFGVTVYTSPQRWFENDVEARSRGQITEWAAQLDAVLDVRFDDGDSGSEPADSKDSKSDKAGQGDRDSGQDVG
ncbi:hypothetical protein [Streptomyces yaizuensis]|uniref:Uncharacterized protein n=1 Tax=Streptomyces yaizuensis TaxID=2989713 RepID=A0ABQ5P1T5_9ACTN|nr:hypothetical protein [Streptomyces sp. YSPA8]GLF96573.1 hypothetical protein SYYSPA8_19770 [Streptomyces sp. YSPA8]